MGAENDNSMRHTIRFEHLTVAYGYSREDARKKAAAVKYSIHEVSRNATDRRSKLIDGEFWIEPQQPLDVSKRPTPFPAVGLATFVPGRAQVLNVKWKGTAGFDDAGSTKLDVATNWFPKFFYLEPPAEIRFTNGGIYTVTIDRRGEFPAETELKLPTLVWTVQLDSWINYYDTSAAMVYPADQLTERLFAKAPRTKDNLGQLTRYGMDLIRWVEPENMRVLRHFPTEVQ
jgi:hypothetical protein